jgi:hypothetical protein
MGELKNAYTVLVIEPENERLLGRPTRGWGNNIKFCVKK